MTFFVHETNAHMAEVSLHSHAVAIFAVANASSKLLVAARTERVWVEQVEEEVRRPNSLFTSPGSDVVQSLRFFFILLNKQFPFIS